jgi:hypothetical protein
MKIVSTNFVQTPLLSLANGLDINIAGFPLFPTTVDVNWRLYDRSTGNTIQSGIINVPADVVSSWGTDDNVIKDYVLTQLNLSEDTSPDPAPPQSTEPEPDINNP